MKDTFTSAFPRSNEVNEYGSITMYADAGMTLRDYFAAKAMQSLIAASFSDLKVTREDVIGEAYKYADDMMQERLK